MNELNSDNFLTVTFEEASKIADGLLCTIGNIKAGLPDDFLSQYMGYYHKNKGKRKYKPKKGHTTSIYPTKAVFFDFDGTLTLQNDQLTTWEKIWVALGYTVNDCASLHSQYSSSEISHKQWCQITEKEFKNKNMKNTVLDKIASDIHLMQGVKEVINLLESKYIRMYIVSGSIHYVIKKVLGNMLPLFTGVKANDMRFNSNSTLKTIIGTKYDFEGKADYITHKLNEIGIQPYEALFVGNSLNDEWAHQSGVDTLCINPSATNHDHPFQWTFSIKKSTDFQDILKYIHFEEEIDIE